jgi:hypothetical protein
MTLPFEQKHKDLKKYSKVSYSRVNLSWSISYKISMHFQKLIDGLSKGFPSDTYHDKKQKIEKSSAHGALISQFFGEKVFAELKSLVNKKKAIRLSNYVCMIQNDQVMLHSVEKILFSDEKYYLLLQNISIEYSEHYLSYIVGSKSNVHKIINLDELKFPPLNVHKTICGMKMFRIKYL